MSRHTIAEVLAYHRRTKHQPHRHARSLGFMDWANQPNPFRLYEGSSRIELDHPRGDDGLSLAACRDPRAVASRNLSRDSVSQLFFDSLALSAWKKAGANRWSLRCNPSSGNLHPTEGYLVAGTIEGLSGEPAVFHYSPLLHALECRATLDAAAWQAVADALPRGSFLVGLTSIHWRESWKYGERAYRYCQLDAGHAMAALCFAAAAMGWRVRLLDGCSDRALTCLLGIADQSGAEAEHADALLLVAPAAHEATVRDLDDHTIEDLAPAQWIGTANKLSENHHPWPVIDEVSAACRKPETTPCEAHPQPPQGPRKNDLPPTPARRIFRQRRSAVSMDGVSELGRAAFLAMVDAVRTTADAVPFAAFSHPPAVHPVYFVHRVDGLEPGLYIQVREPARRHALRSAMREDFTWAEVDASGLYELFTGDVRDTARAVSCHQDIASDGVFAVAMIADFEPTLHRYGAWFYRHLHWQAGALGHVLYLEAEAVGLSATGIGCFYDDAVHELLGLEGGDFHTLYHLTTGRSVEDPRLQTLAAYHHLQGR